MWQLGGVVDDAAKVALACPVSATQTWRDAVGVLEDARERAGELPGQPRFGGLHRPRNRRHRAGVRRQRNGACYRAAGFAAHIRARPEFAHVRTRHQAPETNGVIERFFQSAKYEHLYRHDIGGQDLAEHVERFVAVYHEIRPHEALDFQRPLDRYLRPPSIARHGLLVGPC